jgi:hypothetical protein
LAGVLNEVAGICQGTAEELRTKWKQPGSAKQWSAQAKRIKGLIGKAKQDSQRTSPLFIQGKQDRKATGIHTVDEGPRVLAC